MSAKIERFNKHRPADRSDPGFTVPGRHLRWISGKVAENSPGRPWQVIRKQDLPKDLLEHIERTNPGAFSQGETIRRGDLVLAFAPEEQASGLRKDIRESARDQEQKIKRAPRVMDKHGKNRASVEVDEEEDVTSQMIARFKQSEET